MSSDFFSRPVQRVAHAALWSVIATASSAFAAQSALSVAERTLDDHEENVDRYARRLLEQRLSRDNAVPAAAAAQPLHAGEVGPVELELIYIAGIGSAARAMVRIDKRYAKLAAGGDSLAGWTLSAIGHDYVDIRRDDQHARLYLFSTFKQANEG